MAILELAKYIPLEPSATYSKIAAGLPDWVKEGLFQDPEKRPAYYVTVETSRTDIVAYLDKELEINKTNHFIKYIDREIDRKEIPYYDYFQIMPTFLNLGEGVYAELIRSTCPTFELCPVGSGVGSPVTVAASKCKKLGMAYLWHVRAQRLIFLISADTKKLFETENIIGLDYEPCKIESKGSEASDLEHPWLARPNHLIDSYADRIYFDKEQFCSMHSVLSIYRLAGRYVRRTDLKGYDFTSVATVKVDNIQYQYPRHGLIVSRKVVEVLLNKKIRGLTPIGFYWGNPYLPIISVGAERSEFNY